MKTDKFKYKDVCPIDTATSSAWLVIFRKKEQRLLIMDKAFTLPKVVEYVKIHNRGEKFFVQRIDVGEFIVSKCENSYCGDARGLDESGFIVLDTAEQRNELR